MDIKEVAAFLGISKDIVKKAIDEGIQLTNSKKTEKLTATKINGDYNIDDDELDRYIKVFEIDDPGRHPPVNVRRILLVEASHKCGICRSDAPLNYHHIIEYASLPHHDPDHMLPVCGTCHDKLTNGFIDKQCQYNYKNRLKENAEPIRFDMEDLKILILKLNELIKKQEITQNKKNDFSYVNPENGKNEINKMGQPYFEFMKEQHEPYFHLIDKFLKNPINSKLSELYYNVIEDIGSKIAFKQGSAISHFEEILLYISDGLVKDYDSLKNKKRIINAFLSYMYFNCDIGRKS
jgi:hypothetical protein